MQQTRPYIVETKDSAGNVTSTRYVEALSNVAAIAFCAAGVSARVMSTREAIDFGKTGKTFEVVPVEQRKPKASSGYTAAQTPAAETGNGESAEAAPVVTKPKSSNKGK